MLFLHVQYIQLPKIPKPEICCYRRSASNLMYSFAEIIEAQRKGEYNVIEKDIFAKYEDSRFDARELNGGKGYPLSHIVKLIEKARKEDKKDRYRSTELDREVFQNIKLEEDEVPDDGIFLLTFNVLRQARQCVYGIFKNTYVVKACLFPLFCFILA